MRFFVTSLLLFCFQAFVVCTAEDGSVTFAQDFNFNTKQKVNKIVKEQSHLQYFTISNHQLTDFSNYQLNKQLSVFSNFLNKDKPVFTKRFSTIIKVFKNKEHSYNFIFRCLYPKHTFW